MLSRNQEGWRYSYRRNYWRIGFHRSLKGLAADNSTPEDDSNGESISDSDRKETLTELGDSGSFYYTEYSGSFALYLERFNRVSRGFFLPDLFHQFRHLQQEIWFLDRTQQTMKMDWHLKRKRKEEENRAIIFPFASPPKLFLPKSKRERIKERRTKQLKGAAEKPTCSEEDWVVEVIAQGKRDFGF